MAPRITGFDHVQLAAPPGCEPEARRFYGTLLGLTELPKPADMALRGGLWFACGPQQLHIGVEADVRPSLKAHLAFRLAGPADVDALAERLTAQGVGVRWATDAPGVRRFHANDPWGNRLEFTAQGT